MNSHDFSYMNLIYMFHELIYEFGCTKVPDDLWSLPSTSDRSPPPLIAPLHLWTLPSTTDCIPPPLIAPLHLWLLPSTFWSLLSTSDCFPPPVIASLHLLLPFSAYDCSPESPPPAIAPVHLWLLPSLATLYLWWLPYTCDCSLRLLSVIATLCLWLLPSTSDCSDCSPPPVIVLSSRQAAQQDSLDSELRIGRYIRCLHHTSTACE